MARTSARVLGTRRGRRGVIQGRGTAPWRGPAWSAVLLGEPALECRAVEPHVPADAHGRQRILAAARVLIDARPRDAQLGGDTCSAVSSGSASVSGAGGTSASREATAWWGGGTPDALAADRALDVCRKFVLRARDPTDATEPDSAGRAASPRVAAGAGGGVAALLGVRASGSRGLTVTGNEDQTRCAPTDRRGSRPPDRTPTLELGARGAPAAVPVDRARRVSPPGGSPGVSER